MKILVTGASGFLGKILSLRLKRLGNEVTEINSKTNDLTKYNSLENLNNEKFDQIYHLATYIQAGDFCFHHQSEVWMINQQMHTNMLGWWQKYQPGAKMIAMGTSCAYDPKYPLSEDNYLKGEPIDSLLSYGMTKKMLLTGLMAMNKQYGLNYLYLIPSTLYGPGYHTDDRQLHFIFDLMRKIIKGSLKGDTVTLWGDGYQKRELVHVEDFINIMLELVKTQNNEVFNIGAGKEHTIREFANKICNHVGYDEKKIVYDTSKYVGAKSKVLIIDKLKKVLPNWQTTFLEEGFKETIDWFLENKTKILSI